MDRDQASALELQRRSAASMPKMPRPFPPSWQRAWLPWDVGTPASDIETGDVKVSTVVGSGQELCF